MSNASAVPRHLNVIALDRALKKLSEKSRSNGGIYPDCGDCVDLAFAIEKFVSEFPTKEDAFSVEILWRHNPSDFEGTRQLLHCCASLGDWYLDGSKEVDPIDALLARKEMEIEKGILPDGFEQESEIDFDVCCFNSCADFDFSTDRFKKSYDGSKPLVDPENQAHILDLIKEAYSVEYDALPTLVKAKQVSMGF